MRKKFLLKITNSVLLFYYYTGSQNHRMVGFGRDLCGSSSPTPLPKQGHPEQAIGIRFRSGLGTTE